MNTGLKQISVSLLFIVGMADASADPERSRWDAFTRSFRLQMTAIDRGEQRNDPGIVDGDEHRGATELGRQDTSGFANQGDHPPNSANDNSRRQGRMSPEERRALRRQIDEARHDVYRPKH